MKRIAIAVALLLGGTAVAHANPPGLTPGPAPIDVDVDIDVGPGGRGGPGWDGPSGPMARGERGPMARGERGPRGARMGQHRLPARLRARLVQMFDRDGDGRLQGPERRAARRFVKRVIVRRLHAQHGRGPRGPR
jgi:hypothetical protein